MIYGTLYVSDLSNFFIHRTNERDPPPLQVLPAVEEVVEDSVEAEKHAVDGEVPPVGVEPPVLGELDVGLPAVAHDVDTQCRHLDKNFTRRGWNFIQLDKSVVHLEVLAVVDTRRHRAVLLAERVDGAHALCLEHGLHLVGRRCRREV